MSPRSSLLSTVAVAVGVALGASVAFAGTDESSPSSFTIGSAQFTIGGSVELTSILRASNTGNTAATAFGSIPYENTVQGHNSEWRMSAQRSVLSMKVADQFGGTAVTACTAGDFAGNSASNLFVTANGHTFRLTHAWVGIDHGRWNILAGQTWSWLTPGLEHLDPMRTFTTRNLDLNFQVGLPWTRAAQFRAVYNATEHLAAGVALENPQQFLGAGEVIFPFAFNATLGPQVDANNNPGAPNYLPDLLAKLAFDGGGDDGHAFHVEAVGLARWFRVTFIPIGGTSFDHAQANGLGAGLSTSYTRDWLRLVASGFRGDGVGRYLGGLGPDIVVVPDNPIAGVSLTTVHAQSFLFGAECELPGANALAAYFGRVDFGRNSFPDVTSPLVVKPIIGFGGLNSPNSANRTLHQLSVDASHTFWDSPEHGAFALEAQFSEVFRQPWFSAVGAPNRALVDMAFLNVRYTLP